MKRVDEGTGRAVAQGQADIRSGKLRQQQELARDRVADFVLERLNVVSSLSSKRRSDLGWISRWAATSRIEWAPLSINERSACLTRLDIPQGAWSSR